MDVFMATVRELVGLFVDDGKFAIAILGVVCLAIASAGLDAPLPVTGSILFVGCLLVLTWSVLSATRKR